MYIPKLFEETRLSVLHDLIRSHPFCSLVTMGPSDLFASHIPMVLEPDVPPFGLLKGHVSRANPQWKEFSPEVRALAIFSGPHHYVTPSWYPEKRASGKVVPTWNYAVVHAYGHLRTIEDAERLRAHVESLTQQHEASFAEPWTPDDAPPDFIQSMLKGIVGLELAIERIEGKWKVNQNRSEQDRRGVAEGLHELNTSESLAMKELVVERIPSTQTRD